MAFYRNYRPFSESPSCGRISPLHVYDLDFQISESEEAYHPHFVSLASCNNAEMLYVLCQFQELVSHKSDNRV